MIEKATEVFWRNLRDLELFEPSQIDRWHGFAKSPGATWLQLCQTIQQESRLTSNHLQLLTSEQPATPVAVGSLLIQRATLHPLNWDAYDAVHVKLQQLARVVLLPDSSQDGVGLQALQRARQVATLDDAQVTRIVDLETFGSRYALVLSESRGERLSQVWANAEGKIDWFALAAQLFGIVQRVHRSGLGIGVLDPLTIHYVRQRNELLLDDLVASQWINDELIPNGLGAEEESVLIAYRAQRARFLNAASKPTDGQSVASINDTAHDWLEYAAWLDFTATRLDSAGTTPVAQRLHQAALDLCEIHRRPATDFAQWYQRWFESSEDAVPAATKSAKAWNSLSSSANAAPALDDEVVELPSDAVTIVDEPINPIPQIVLNKAPTKAAAANPASDSRKGKPATDKPSAGKPATDKPAVGVPAAAKPAAEIPAIGTLAAEKPTIGKPATGTPAAEKPAAGKSKTASLADKAAAKRATEKRRKIILGAAVITPLPICLLALFLFNSAQPARETVPTVGNQSTPAGELPDMSLPSNPDLEPGPTNAGDKPSKSTSSKVEQPPKKPESPATVAVADAKATNELPDSNIADTKVEIPAVTNPPSTADSKGTTDQSVVVSTDVKPTMPAPADATVNSKATSDQTVAATDEVKPTTPAPADNKVDTPPASSDEPKDNSVAASADSEQVPDLMFDPKSAASKVWTKETREFPREGVEWRFQIMGQTLKAIDKNHASWQALRARPKEVGYCADELLDAGSVVVLVEAGTGAKTRLKARLQLVTPNGPIDLKKGAATTAITEAEQFAQACRLQFDQLNGSRAAAGEGQRKQEELRRLDSLAKEMDRYKKVLEVVAKNNDTLVDKGLAFGLVQVADGQETYLLKSQSFTVSKPADK